MNGTVDEDGVHVLRNTAKEEIASGAASSLRCAEVGSIRVDIEDHVEFLELILASG